MTHEERIARAAAAEQAMEQFLRPAFERVFAVHMRALMEIVEADPDNDCRIKTFAWIAKLVRQAQADVEAVVRDGDAAISEKRVKDRVAGFSPERKRWALMSGGH